MKKVISAFLAIVMLFSLCGFYSSGASKQIKSLKIVSEPTKKVFYKNTDWIYGVYETLEEGKGKTRVVSSDKISFTHNPGGGFYPDRGMIDMTGLVLEVTYTDNSKKTVTYKETLNSSGFYTANIAVSPKGGREFSIGANTLEVYLTEDYHFYDTYTITISSESGSGSSSGTKGDINGDNKINSSDALLALQHSVGLITLSSDQKKKADMNSDGKINSTDALMIMRKAVG